jgi:hypothetical protein
VKERLGRHVSERIYTTSEQTGYLAFSWVVIVRIAWIIVNLAKACKRLLVSEALMLLLDLLLVLLVLEEALLALEM